MMSRFSLPGVSSLFSSRTSYSPEEVNMAVRQIKLLGKRSNNGTDETSMNDIQEILKLMSRFSDSLSVQRVACHALSNLAMQVVSARWIVQKDGLRFILNAIDRFITDHKLCWLASSAIWNLARPPGNRAAIGKAGANAMLRILYEHRDREKVTNTAIGALSNLSLLDNLKDMIAETSQLELVLAVLTHSFKREYMSVMTSGAGLLANIAVSDSHAAKLTTMGALDMILDLLEWPTADDTLFRNACAALNNLVTADGFLCAFLRARGLEKVLSFLGKHEDSDMYRGLLENCLVTIDAEVGVQTTSLHYACFHGELDTLKFLLKQDATSDFKLEGEDERNMTCLDYALSSNHKDVVLFLAKLGATLHSQDVTEDMQSVYDEGAAILKDTRDANKEAMENTLQSFPTDLCNLMLTFQDNTDMLKAMDRL